MVGSVLDLRGTNVVASKITGPITGAVTGNITGNVTGDVTGDLTGTVTDSQGIVTSVVHDVTDVDTSAGGTAQTTNCALVPANSVILNVRAEVLVPMDGDTTTTLEVGVSGNIDAYIDTVDFDPTAVAGTAKGSASGTTNDVTTVQFLAAATQVIATWTNTASAAAGTIRVTVSYLPVAA